MHTFKKYLRTNTKYIRYIFKYFYKEFGLRLTVVCSTTRGNALYFESFLFLFISRPKYINPKTIVTWKIQFSKTFYILVTV